MRQVIKAILKYPAIILNHIYLSLYYGRKETKDLGLNPMLKKQGQKILVLAPHVDDETIGLGGSLIKHRKQGDQVYLVYMADGSGAVSELSPEDLVMERKKEAWALRDALELEEPIFMDIEDCQVGKDPTVVPRLREVLEKIRPDIIYTPHLIDGHIDHVATSRALIGALEEWRQDFDSIYLYEVNTSINPARINSIVDLSSEDYQQKMNLYQVFKSQYVMGFDAFHMVSRYKARLAKGAYGAETFTRISLENLREFNKYLETEGFDPNNFRQLSSRYNLILSYMKNRNLKETYLEKIRTGF